MYQFVDRPLDSVGNLTRFLVWAMRDWTKAVEQKTCPPAALNKGFAGIGALPALPDLHMAMVLLNRHSLSQLGMGAMGCPHIVEDEAVLLSLWQGYAQDQRDSAVKTLALLVKNEAVGPLGEAMNAATAKLIAAGFDPETLSGEILKAENE